MNALIRSYRSYAQAVAAQMLRRLPPCLDRDDVLAYAELGLVEAAREFNPARGVHFKTFSYYRIRGAVYDGLRKEGWLSRGLFREIRSGAYLLSLEQLSCEPAHGGEDSPHDRLQRREAGERIRSCLSRLPRRHRLVLQQYYFEEKTLEEIGKQAGLSKSWVCRLHVRALEMMRDRLQEAGRRATFSGLGREVRSGG